MTRNFNLDHFMKQTLVLLLTLASLVSVQAQGTVQFVVNLSGSHAVPPNDIPGGAGGPLTLTDNTLSYEILGSTGASFFPTNATINGPAKQGATAPILFDLGSPIN